MTTKKSAPRQTTWLEDKGIDTGGANFWSPEGKKTLVYLVDIEPSNEVKELPDGKGKLTLRAVATVEPYFANASLGPRRWEIASSRALQALGEAADGPGQFLNLWTTGSGKNKHYHAERAEDPRRGD